MQKVTNDLEMRILLQLSLQGVVDVSQMASVGTGWFRGIGNKR